MLLAATGFEFMDRLVQNLIWTSCYQRSPQSCVFYIELKVSGLMSLTMILFRFVSIPFLCWCLPVLGWGTSSSFLKTLVGFDFIHSYSSLNTAQIFQTHYLEFVSVNEYWLKMYCIDYFALLWCISVPFCSVYNFTESRTTCEIFCLYIH